MVFNMHIALKKNCVCFFQTNILKPVILNVNWIVYIFTTRIWTILPSSNTGLRKQNDVATNTRNSDAFFSCHVINGPDYSNEHMNLKTTSQKLCIYISYEINRREGERDRPYRNSPNSMVFSGEVQSNTWRLIVNRIILFLRYRIQVVHLSGMRTPRPLEFW